MDPLFTKAQVDFQERIEILPAELLALVTDGTLDAVVFRVSQKYALTEEQSRLLENEIILVLTLFFGTDTFVENVQESLGIDNETARGIHHDVSEDLFSLVQDIIDTVAKAKREIQTTLTGIDLGKRMEKRDDLTRLQEAFTQQTPLAPKTDTNEDALSSVQPIRTMEQDMSKVHGYGAYREMEAEQQQTISSQDEILKKELPS